VCVCVFSIEQYSLHNNLQVWVTIWIWVKMSQEEKLLEPHFGDLDLISFSYNRSCINTFLLLGTRCWLSYNRISYIRFSYNRTILSNNKEQFCRDPACPFLIFGFSYIRLSYNRSVLYNSAAGCVMISKN
jgi:hypothetical protein